jgi:hypothetical protein
LVRRSNCRMSVDTSYDERSPANEHCAFERLLAPPARSGLSSPSSVQLGGLAIVAAPAECLPVRLLPEKSHIALVNANTGNNGRCRRDKHPALASRTPQPLT